MLECNTIEEVNFEKRELKIANKIYGYSKGAVDGKFKHPQKGIKMDRTTADVTALVPPRIIENYKYIHLDLDVLFMNNMAFMLVKSRDIGFIHCKAILINPDKQVMNGLK